MIARAMAGQPHTEIDEQWFDEYVDFGWVELVAYLMKQAKFWVYLVENHRLEEEEDPL